MGKSFRKEKNFGPRKRSAGGQYNPRREERQRIRRNADSQLNDIVDKFKNDNVDELDTLEDYERFRETYKNGETPKT